MIKDAIKGHLEVEEELKKEASLKRKVVMMAGLIA